MNESNGTKQEQALARDLPCMLPDDCWAEGSFDEENWTEVCLASSSEEAGYWGVYAALPKRTAGAIMPVYYGKHDADEPNPALSYREAEKYVRQLAETRPGAYAVRGGDEGGMYGRTIRIADAATLKRCGFDETGGLGDLVLRRVIQDDVHEMADE